MARTKSNRSSSANNSAQLGFEAKQWLAADKLRSNMDAGEYKHVVLGLIFLKYISDTFEEHHAKLVAGEGNYAKHRLGELIDLIGTIVLVPGSARDPRALIGDPADQPSAKNDPAPSHSSRSKDILGRVYEYFLSQFASAEGKKGGQFYTPQSVVRLLVEMLAPYKGRIYDPCCGSGGVAKCEVRSASVEVKTSRPFVIRNSAFDISTTPPRRHEPRPARHRGRLRPRARRHLPPRRANGECRNANLELKHE
jgi:type I restriction enzyme M protein